MYIPACPTIDAQTQTHTHRYSDILCVSIYIIPWRHQRGSQWCPKLFVFFQSAPFRSCIQETWKLVIANILKAAIFHPPETPDDRQRRWGVNRLSIFPDCPCLRIQQSNPYDSDLLLNCSAKTWVRIVGLSILDSYPLAPVSSKTVATFDPGNSNCHRAEASREYSVSRTSWSCNELL